MILKNKIIHFVAIILIFFISLCASFLINVENFTKNSLRLDYKFQNYYLTSPEEIHKYLNTVMPILKEDQYIIRDESVTSAKCNFLNKKINSFTITNRPNSTFRAELFSNKNVSSENLNECFDSFFINLDDYTKNLYKSILSSDIKKLKSSIAYYKKLIDESNLEPESKLIVLLRSYDDKENLFILQNFLHSIDNTSTVILIKKNYNSFSVKQKTIFAAFFVIFLICYLAFNNRSIGRNLIKRIFS